MAYNADLESRVDAVVMAKGWQLSKISMFGTMAYKSGDRLCFTIRDDGLILRGSGKLGDRLRAMPAVKPAVMGSRTMKDWWQVPAEVLQYDPVLLSLLIDTKKFADSTQPEL